MVNKNYVRGRRKEYKIKGELEALGYIVLRSAGSHGFADLIAIDPNRFVIKLIQCKPDSMNPTIKDRLMGEWDFISGLYKVTFEIK